MVQEPDRHTLEKAQQGDPLAQRRVLELYVRRLRYLVGRLGDRQDVEDQMQDLYAKVLVSLPRYRPGGRASLGTWIFSLAHNWLVSRRRRPGLRLVPLEFDADVPDERPGADDALESAQLQQRLDHAIGQLSEPLRRAFVLSQIHQQSMEAIAEVEKVPVGTVKSRLHRARAELTLLLGDALDEKGETRAAAARA
jgi:RNA polymerase sigma-70 factor (ECF subfamily)